MQYLVCIEEMDQLKCKNINIIYCLKKCIIRNRLPYIHLFHVILSDCILIRMLILSRMYIFHVYTCTYLIVDFIGGIQLHFIEWTACLCPRHTTLGIQLTKIIQHAVSYLYILISIWYFFIHHYSLLIHLNFVRKLTRMQICLKKVFTT